MKKILLSSVALLGFSAGALAADLPSRRAPAPFVPAVPVFTWTGFYVGVNAGYGWGNSDDSTVTFPAGTFGATPTVVRFSDDDNDGVLGGAQVGYNFQFGQFVVGVEADIQAADLGGGNGRGTGVLVSGPGFGTTVFHSRNNGLDWFGTVRGRAGFAFDRALVYATGGFAFGGGDSNGCGVLAAGVIGCGDDDSRSGWTIGGGVEWAFTNNLTFGLEGLFVSLENDNGATNFVGRTAGGAVIVSPTTFTRGDDDQDFGLVRAKVNFKF